MEKERISEVDCKRVCDAAIGECEEGRIYPEECENKWDRCMGDCMSECEIYS